MNHVVAGARIQNMERVAGRQILTLDAVDRTRLPGHACPVLLQVRHTNHAKLSHVDLKMLTDAAGESIGAPAQAVLAPRASQDVTSEVHCRAARTDRRRNCRREHAVDRSISPARLKNQHRVPSCQCVPHDASESTRLTTHARPILR
jgi:hypothetical protein